MRQKNYKLVTKGNKIQDFHNILVRKTTILKMMKKCHLIWKWKEDFQAVGNMKMTTSGY